MTLEVPARMPYLGLLRAAVAGLEAFYAGAPGAPGTRQVYAWSLGVYEAATNIVRHAYAGGSDEGVRLTIAPTSGRVVFTLSDRGLANPGRPLQAPPPLQEGGHGLLIMERVFDVIDYRREGDENVLRLEARFTGEARPPGEPDAGDGEEAPTWPKTTTR